MSKVVLKDVASIASGATPSTAHPEFYDGNIVWFTPKDLSDQKTKYVSKGERNITKAGYDSCSTTMLPPKTVLMSSRAPIGLLAISTCECCTNQGFKSIVCDEAKLNPEYLYYYLKYHIKEVEALGSGTTFKEVSRGSMESFVIDIPSIKEQKRIASMLGYLDSKISNNNAIISELESMAKDIYDYWFVQFDFPDENGKPYKSSGGKMVWNDEIKREIPEGWKPAKIGDLATIKRGISYSASSLVADGLPMINLNSFTPSATYKTSGIKYYKGEVKEGGQVDAYDLLMCTTQQTDIDGKTDIIGKTMLIPDLFDSRMVFSMDLVKIQTDELLKTVIVSETKTPWYNKYITGFATGTSILHLKLDGFLSYQIPLPKDTAILRHFNSMFMEWERRKSIAMKENEELTSLRDWLLPMLMNGQVKVGGVT